MKSHTSKRYWAMVGGVGLALGVAALSACEEPRVPPTALHGIHEAAAVSSARLDDVEDVLRTLKSLTQKYRSLDAARAAGYDAPLTQCMSSTAGGMGYHYGSLPLFDAKVEPLRPEILMYEPQKNGDLLFVGVEYAVPYTAWTSADPPTLAGVPFHRNDTFQLWVLHAWIWKPNPSGTLTDWNPRVTCQYAAN